MVFLYVVRKGSTSYNNIYYGRLHTSELTPELTLGQNVQPRVVKLKVNSELTLSYQTLTWIADGWVK